MHWTSDIYRIAPRQLAAMHGRRLLWRWWWVAAVPTAAAMVAALVDVRFAYVALLLVLIVWPMALSIAWLWICMAPEVVRASLPSRVTITDDVIMVERYSADADLEEGAPTQTETYAIEAVKRVERSGSIIELEPISVALPAAAVPTETLDWLQQRVAGDINQLIW